MGIGGYVITVWILFISIMAPILLIAAMFLILNLAVPFVARRLDRR